MSRLDGVLTDAWRLYRAQAVRLILVAAAFFLPAMGIDALIYGSGGAAILASILAGAWSLLPLAGHFAVLISLPTLYLAFMGLVTMPVAVIERSGPLTSWRRSWHLIRRNEWTVFGTLALAWLVNIPVMLIPIVTASYPGLPYPQRRILLWVVEDIVFGPFLVLAVTLIYYRLSEARRSAESAKAFSGQPGGDAAGAGA